MDIEECLILPFTEKELKQQRLFLEQEKIYLEEIKLANFKWEKTMGKIEIDQVSSSKIKWGSTILL